MAFQDDDGADPAPPLVPGPPLPPGAGAAPPLPPLPSDGGPQPPLPPTTDAKEQVEEEEEDPLVVAQRRREEEEQALQEAADIHEDDDPLLKVGAPAVDSRAAGWGRSMGGSESVHVLVLMAWEAGRHKGCEARRGRALWDRQGRPSHRPSPPPPLSSPRRLCQEFYADMKAVDRENEVNRILGAFKLNPYEQLGLRFDVEPSDIARQYRKSSLMVHPDKCSHPKAKPAFEIIGEALKQLKDPERKRVLDEYLGVAKGAPGWLAACLPACCRGSAVVGGWTGSATRSTARAFFWDWRASSPHPQPLRQRGRFLPHLAPSAPPQPVPPRTFPPLPTYECKRANANAEQVLKDWRKAAKHDAAVRVASSMDQRGLEGVQAAYEETQQFHDAWKLKARDVLARSEWHRRKQIKRVGRGAGVRGWALARVFRPGGVRCGRRLSPSSPSPPKQIK